MNLKTSFINVGVFSAAIILTSYAAGTDKLNAKRLFDPSQLLAIKIEIPEDDWRRLCREMPDGSDSIFVPSTLMSASEFWTRKIDVVAPDCANPQSQCKKF